MSKRSTIATVFRAERWPLAVTYAVTLVENLFTLLYPWTTGLAIDGLLAGQGLRALVPLVAIWLLHHLVGAARRVYDTRVFARLHAALATAMVARQRATGIAATEIAARTAMARELVDFFERELPVMATALVGLVGGVALLLLYDLGVGLIVAALLVPLLTIYLLFGRRAAKASLALNDETEREGSLIALGRLRRSRPFPPARPPARAALQRRGLELVAGRAVLDHGRGADAPARDQPARGPLPAISTP
ncbi:MAG: ABC transporter six-transmembrane domain-containing protein [Geminicoccaceae bacterium]